MQMISLQAHSCAYKYPKMLRFFILSWINNGIKAAAIANGRMPRKTKPFNPATVTEVFKKNPDLECFIRVLNEVLELFSSSDGLELINWSIYSSTRPNINLKLGKICLQEGSDLFHGFLLNLVKERRIQTVSIIKRPLWTTMIDADLATRMTPFVNSSNRKTISLTVQTGVSKKQSISKDLSFHHLSLKVVEEDNLMDQSSIQSVTSAEDGIVENQSPLSSVTSAQDEIVENQCSLSSVTSAEDETAENQCPLSSVTSAEDGTIENQSPLSSVTSAQDETVEDQSPLSSVTSAPEGIVENQSSMWPANFGKDCSLDAHKEVIEETLYHSQRKRNLQFGMLESEESWKLGSFVPKACTDPSQSGFPAEEFKPIFGPKRWLFTWKEGRNLEFEDVPANIEMLNPENERCMSPDSGLSDMNLSPPRHASKEPCGIRYAEKERCVSPDDGLGDMNLSPDDGLGDMNLSPDDCLGDMNLSPDSVFDDMNLSPDSDLGDMNLSPDSVFDNMNLSPDSSLDDMNLSAPRHASKEKCGICSTEIEKSKFFDKRRYGLLSKCNHVFCYRCIYEQSEPTLPTFIRSNLRRPIPFRSAICPICHKKSAAIASSPVWMEGTEKYNFFKKFAQEMKRGSRNLDTCSTATLLSSKQLVKNVLLERSFLPSAISV